jgi:GDP-L-fucose synthase
MQKVLILGNGLVGKAMHTRLSKCKDFEVLILNKSELDLMNLENVEKSFENINPDILILAAGVVGGIEKNINEPFDLGLENSQIILNVIQVSLKVGIKNFVNLVPACVYPANISRRMKPDDLWTGPMESTSLTYSTAKLLGVTLVDAARKQFNMKWISVIATNLYGEQALKSNHNAHVIPALLQKFTDAKREKKAEIVLLGDGTPIREFLHVDDFALAIEFILQKKLFTESIINVSGSSCLQIKELAELIRKEVNYAGKVRFSNDEKNGAMVKLLDGSQLQSYGWSPLIDLEEGVARVYSNFK